MTRQEALDLAAERGHRLDPTLRPNKRLEVSPCSACGSAVYFFSETPDRVAIYGSALETNCTTSAAA